MILMSAVLARTTVAFYVACIVRVHFTKYVACLFWVYYILDSTAFVYVD